MPGPLTADFFARDTLVVARDLVGVTMLHGGAGGVIVETEAYKDDPASHFVTRRRQAGHLIGSTYGKVYVYLIYGMHRCLNFTTDARGPGAVLIRALEPTHGIEEMMRRRGTRDVRALANGPAKLYVALGLDASTNGRDATEVFTFLPRTKRVAVTTGPRVGIAKAVELPWRFAAKGSPFVSR